MCSVSGIEINLSEYKTNISVLRWELDVLWGTLSQQGSLQKPGLEVELEAQIWQL